LQTIEQDAYLATLNKLVDEKWNSLKGVAPLTRRKKTIDWLAGRGYELEHIMPLLQSK